MKFEVGQTVELIDNGGMSAQLGATAVVTRANHIWCGLELIDIKWKTNSDSQWDGGYESCRFKSALKKGEQLLFNFMGQNYGS